MPSLPEGWEVIGDGVREVRRDSRVRRAVFISNGVLFNLNPNGTPSAEGVPISIVTYLMRVE